MPVECLDRRDQPLARLLRVAVEQHREASYSSTLSRPYDLKSASQAMASVIPSRSHTLKLSASQSE
jgi:hypothetical protein